MEQSTYPIQDSPFYQTNDKDITNNTLNKCITTQGYKQECEPTVVNGYHKPLNESCKPLDISKEFTIDNQCTSIWNNITSRKMLVKDY